MMAPIPSMVRWTGPRVRLSACSSATTGSGCSDSSAVLISDRVLELPARWLGVAGAVEPIDDKADDRPNGQPQPGVERQEHHHETAHEDAERAHGPDQRRPERALHVWALYAQHHHADADDDEGEKRADGHELAQDIERQNARAQRAEGARDERAAPRRLEARVDLAEQRRDHPVLRHRVKDARLTEQ